MTQSIRAIVAAFALAAPALFATDAKPEYELWVYGYNLVANAHELTIKDAKFKWQPLGKLAPGTDWGKGRDAASVVPVPAGVITDVVELRTFNPRGGSWFAIIKAVYVMPYAGTSHEQATRQIQADPDAVLARARFARVWTLERGQTNVGIFSVETRRRHMRIGPTRPFFPDAAKRIRLRPDADGKVDLLADFSPDAIAKQAIVRGKRDSALYFHSLRNKFLHTRGTAGMRTQVTVDYRFTCDRALRGIRVAALCRASARYFAASVTMSLGVDGAAWPLSISTRDMAKDPFWGDLALDASAVPELAGVGEFWVRFEFDVRCAVDTRGGASVERLEVTARAGEPLPKPQPAPAHLKFQKAQQQLAARGKPTTRLVGTETKGIRMSTMAGDDVPAVSEPDRDCAGGLDANSAADATCWKLSEQLVARVPRYSHPGIYPVHNELVVPLRVAAAGAPALVEVGYKASPDGSPRMVVSWDSEPLAEVDTRCPYAVLRVVQAVVPADRAAGEHRLTIADADGDTSATNGVTVDAIRITALDAVDVVLPTEPKPGPRLPLALHAGYFQPDANPDAVQLAGMARHFKKGFDYSTCGALHVYVRNTGSEPIRVREVKLFGKPIEQCRRPFKSIWRPDEESGKHGLEFDRAQVLWYRVRPETIEPGRVAELIVRFARAPSAERVPVALGDGRGRLASFDIVRQPPGLTLATAAFSQALDELTLAVACPDANDAVTSVLLDGRDITSDCTIRATGFAGGLWLVQAKLRPALARGSYHVVKLSTRAGRDTANELRAEPAFFSIGLFGSFAQILDGRKRLHVNTFVGHGAPNREQMAQAHAAGMHVLAYFNVNINEYKRYPALHAYYMTDEPDAKDDPLVLGRPRWIGRQTYGLEHEFQRALRRIDPLHPSFLLADQTTIPFNYFIYGPLGDIFCTDPYSYNPRYVRAITRTARRASAPRPCWIATKSYWRPGRGRPVSPAEARLNVLAAVGEGAAGISYWIYDKRTSGFAGMAASAPLEAEASKVNAELEQAAPLLAFAAPTEAARTDNAKAVARALLCADKAMVVVVMNNAYEVTKEPLQIAAMNNVRVTVRVPAWLPMRTAALLDGAARSDLPLVRKDGAVSFTLPQLDAARLVLLLP